MMKSETPDVHHAQYVYERYVANCLKQLPPLAIDRNTPRLSEWNKRAAKMRRILRELLGFPKHMPGSLVPWEVRGSIESEHYRIEKIVYESETDPHSRVPALLYVPQRAGRRGLSTEKRPAIILSCGHGGSKSSFYNQIACQLFVRLGCVVLLPDPIGEEERHPSGLIGKRGHREKTYLDRAMEAGRPVIGKMVFDLVRGIDLLASHPLVDPGRIACAGSSLGGTVTQFLAAVDERLAVCINSGWIADYRELGGEDGCCYRLPGLLQHMNQGEMVALAAPRCAYLVMAGRQDEICPPAGAKEMVTGATNIYELYNQGDRCRFVLDEDAGHQPFHISPTAVEWLMTHLQAAPTWSEDTTPSVTTIGDLAARHGVRIEPLYNVRRHQKGAIVYDLDYEIRDLNTLSVLDDDERQRGPYILSDWIDAIEKKLPRSPSDHASDEEIQAWFGAAEDRRLQLKSLLGTLCTFSWRMGVEVSLDELGIQLPGSGPGSTGGRAHTYHLHLDAGTTPGGISALVIYPEKLNDSSIIYLPRSRDHQNFDTDKVSMWLSQGHSVVILSTVKLFDDELLVGTCSTAFNLSLVFSAVDRIVTRRTHAGGEIICHGEVDDVAAWAGALDRRIDRVEIRSIGGIEPSTMGMKRREGVVKGRAQIVDRVGLWSLVFPRQLDVSDTLLTTKERTQLALLKRGLSV